MKLTLREIMPYIDNFCLEAASCAECELMSFCSDERAYNPVYWELDATVKVPDYKWDEVIHMDKPV